MHLLCDFSSTVYSRQRADSKIFIMHDAFFPIDFDASHRAPARWLTADTVHNSFIYLSSVLLGRCSNIQHLLACCRENLICILFIGSITLSSTNIQLEGLDMTTEVVTSQKSRKSE